MLQDLESIVGLDYSSLKAKDFSNIVCSLIKDGLISKEVFVSDRGDGHSGRIDIIISFENGKTIALELDRLKPRKKSIFKLKSYGADESYIITRSPVTIYEQKK